MFGYTDAIYVKTGDCVSLGPAVVVGILVKIGGIPSGVPLDPANTDYVNIMKLVEEDKLTIAPADELKANTGN